MPDNTPSSQSGRLSPEQQTAYVREFQAALRELSKYNLLIPRISVDGIYGPETVAAVAAFQRAHGLSATGQVDPDTWNLLFYEYNRITNLQAPANFIAPFPSPDTVISLGDQGSVVAIIEVMLSEIGRYFHNMGSPEVDWEFTETDAQAVRMVQATAGLEETGGVDKDTWNTLVETYNHVNRPLYDPDQTPNPP